MVTVTVVVPPGSMAIGSMLMVTLGTPPPRWHESQLAVAKPAARACAGDARPSTASAMRARISHDRYPRADFNNIDGVQTRGEEPKYHGSAVDGARYRLSRKPRGWWRGGR